MHIKPLVEQLWPLHRTLVSDGTDEALRIIGNHLPDEALYVVETFPPGSRAWTWEVPPRYVVHDAYLEVVGGPRVADFRKNALHLVSYSQPVDRVLSWPELEPHLHTAPKRPNAIPWQYAYYRNDWGFCISQNQKDALPRDAMFHAAIKAEFVRDPAQGLRVGTAVLHPRGGPSPDAGEFILCAHVCHVNQANDGIAGVATAVEVARRLARTPLPSGSMSVRLLFCPETIGSIAYLSQHPEVVQALKGGIFFEMTGNGNVLALQRSRQDHHLLDRIARSVLQRRGAAFREDGFRKVVVNDELVINGPGVNAPCLSLSRTPYDEYHTSDDTPEIVHEDMLREIADVAEEIVRTFASDYRPRRRFQGPIFLTKYGLWVDWRIDPELNAALDGLMLRLEGDRSVFEVAAELGLPYEKVRDYVERFRAAGLVDALPIPREPTEPNN